MSNTGKKELIKKLKSDRAQICSQLEKFNAFAVNCDSLASKTSVKERLSQCEPLWDAFKSVQLEIEYNDDSQVVEKHNFEELYFETICKFKDLLKEDVQTQPVFANNTVLDSVNVQQNFVKFFYAFIAVVQKFYYLKPCLKGDAAQVIHSIEVNDLNYDIAFKLLCERYENRKFIAHSQVSQFNTFFPSYTVGKNVLNDLRCLADSILKNTRALKSLKEPVDSWDTLLLYIFSSKLDFNSKREWETFYVKADNIKCSDFLKFLNEICHVLENLEQYKGSQSVSQSPSHVQKFKYKGSQNFFAVNEHFDESHENNESFQNIKCYFCKDNSHAIYNCPTFLKMSEQQRISEVKKLHLYLNYFKNNHVSTKCSIKGCRKCGKPHNTLLHVPSREFEKIKNSAEPGRGESVVVESSVVTHSSNSNYEVLLSTACIIIVGQDGKTHEVRALLDCGSQSNFITSNLVSKSSI